MCLFLLLWSPFLLVCRFLLPFHSFLLYPRMYLLTVYIQLNSTYEDCVAVAVPMSTYYEGCCCCTYDLQHSPWLLLLLVIVDQLVYQAVDYCSCHIYHPVYVFYKKKKEKEEKKKKKNLSGVRPIEWLKLIFASYKWAFGVILFASGS